MKKTIKLKLYTDQMSAAVLESQMKMTNFLYNHLLEKANGLRKTFIETGDPEVAKTLYSKRGLRNLVPQVKNEHPFLKTVHSSPLKNAAFRLSESIAAYRGSRKGKRNGKRTGWPGLRSHKAKDFSLLYDEPNKGFKIKNKTLTLSLGKGEDSRNIKLEVPIEKSQDAFSGCIVKQLRICKELGQYLAVIAETKESSSSARF